MAWTVREPPAFRATTTLGAAAPFSSLAVPSITSILFFFIRKATPAFMRRGHAARALDDLVEVEAALVDRQAVVLQVRQLLVDFSPDFSSALVGMQPQFRQMPPRLSRSTMAIFRPSWLARIAAT